MKNRYPFKQRRLDENTILRKFSGDVSESLLEWHRDRQDRFVEVIHGDGWMFQRDNSIPVQIDEGSTFKIKANEWHRIIKGNGDLVIRIVEGRKKKVDGSRSVKMGADKNSNVTRMDFLPDRVLKKIAKEKDVDEAVEPLDEKKRRKKRRKKRKKSKGKALPRQYSAPPGSKREKQMKRASAAYKRGDIKLAAQIRQGMEKQHMAESPRIVERSEIRQMINDAVEEEKLDRVLQELEDIINEKRKRRKRRSKKKGRSSKGLSKAVKKSLDKKADRRCLTRGSVYAEFRKGLSAFLSSGSRKGMSAHQWAHARVNSANPSKKWATVKKRKKCPKKKKKK